MFQLQSLYGLRQLSICFVELPQKQLYVCLTLAIKIMCYDFDKIVLPFSPRLTSSVIIFLDELECLHEHGSELLESESNTGLPFVVENHIV